MQKCSKLVELLKLFGIEIRLYVDILYCNTCNTFKSQNLGRQAFGEALGNLHGQQLLRAVRFKLWRLQRCLLRPRQARGVIRKRSEDSPQLCLNACYLYHSSHKFQSFIILCIFNILCRVPLKCKNL